MAIIYKLYLINRLWPWLAKFYQTATIKVLPAAINTHMLLANEQNVCDVNKLKQRSKNALQ